MNKNDRYVIISCVQEDYSFASKLYDDLKNVGVKVWMSDKDMLSGRNIRQGLYEAFQHCRYFIPIISKHSISQRGTSQREIFMALNILEEFPITEIFVIPVKIDSISAINDHRIEYIKFADFTGSYNEGFSRLLKAVSYEKEFHENDIVIKYVFFDPTQESEIDRFMVKNVYMERKDVLDRIEQYLKKGEKCIYIWGEPGNGKSALSAYLIRKLQADENTGVIYHFIGYSRKNWKEIVFALLEQIQMKFGGKLDYPIHLPDKNKTAELNDNNVREIYRQGLFSVNNALGNEKNRQKRLVIVIDALDELEGRTEHSEKHTCFQAVPCDLIYENISFVVTSRSGAIQTDFVCDYMRNGVSAAIELKRMDKAELEKLAGLYKVSLNEEQKNRLLNISGKSGFKLTDQAFPELIRNNVFKEILNLLHHLKNKEYKTEQDFLTALQEKLGEKAAENHKSLILKLAKQSEGNFLYVTEILKRLQENKDYDLSELPSTVIGFFRKELTEKFRIKDNDLLRQILALVKEFKIHPSDQHFIQLIGREKKKEIVTLLDQISCYLNILHMPEQRKESVYPVFSKRSYSFFHSKFEESLTYSGENYEDSLISEEDIYNARQLIIDWCDGKTNRFETLDENDPRFKYGFDYLPHHYWEIGKYDKYEGFHSFIGRGNVCCEISSRIFLRDLIGLNEGELLRDSDFRNLFKMLFMKGEDKENNHARHTLLRLNSDLTGRVSEDLRNELWNEIILKFEPKSYWFDEIFRYIKGVLSDKKLNIALERIQSSEEILNRYQLRSFYSIAGGRLCNVSRSKECFNPEHGFSYLKQASCIIESITPEELLESSCNDMRFALFRLNRQKGFFFNDYGFALWCCGKIDNAIEYFNKALKFKKNIILNVETDFLEIKISEFFKGEILASIATTKHNFADLLIQKGEYWRAMDLFMESLQDRSRLKLSFIGSINLFKNIFVDISYSELADFLSYFVYAMKPSKSNETLINRKEMYFNYLFNISDFRSSETVLSEIETLTKEKKNQSYIEIYSIVRDRLKIYVCQKKEEEASLYLEKVMSILNEHGEQNTILISDRAYYELWEIIAKAYLLKGNVEKAKEIVFEKLEQWFNQFKFNGLLPRYYKLQSQYYAQTGLPEKAEELSAEAERLIAEGCKVIADKHFPKEVMDYLDYLVNSSGDEKLITMFKNVENRLANGFCPEYRQTP